MGNSPLGPASFGASHLGDELRNVVMDITVGPVPDDLLPVHLGLMWSRRLLCHRGSATSEEPHRRRRSEREWETAEHQPDSCAASADRAIAVDDEQRRFGRATRSTRNHPNQSPASRA